MDKSFRKRAIAAMTPEAKKEFSAMSNYVYDASGLNVSLEYKRLRKETDTALGKVDADEYMESLCFPDYKKKKKTPKRVHNAAWADTFLQVAYETDGGANWAMLMRAQRCLLGDKAALDAAKGQRAAPAYSVELDKLIHERLHMSAKGIYQNLINCRSGIIDMIEDAHGYLVVYYTNANGKDSSQNITLKTLKNRIAKIKKSR